MATSLNRLSARSAAATVEPGRHADGGNLYLLVSKAGAKSWVFMYRQNGKQRELGLGGYRDVPLATARRKAAEYREALAAGIDPRKLRVDTTAPTFAVVAAEAIKSQKPSWSNAKHAKQWETTVARYCGPLLGLRVDEVRVEDVLKALGPIWPRIPDTAARVRMRIEKILDYARAKGWRSGDNPARWKGHLDSLLPPRKRLTRGHHRAMPHKDVPHLMRSLQAAGSVSAMALEFCVLTATRTSETLNAKWSEIDLEGAVWTIPRERMKAKRLHRVPLGGRVLAILNKLHNSRVNEFVFPGIKRGKPLSTMTMLMMMRRLQQPFTVHGFRSTFRDWASEETSFPREVAEQALAHVIENAVERAYRRSDLFDKRRALMTAWEAHCLRLQTSFEAHDPIGHV